MVPIPAVDIADVRIHKHQLEIEASRLVHLAKRVGRRLAKAIDADPSQLGEEWVELAKWYRAVVHGQLAEQRARFVLVKDRPQLSEREVNAEIAQLTEELVLGMPEERLQDLLRQRAGEAKVMP